MKWLKESPMATFLLKFVAFYLLLVVIFPLSQFDEKYDAAFRSLGNTFFSTYGKEGMVRFDKGKDPKNASLNSVMVLKNRLQDIEAGQKGTNVKVAKIYFNPWNFGYLSMGVLLALIFANRAPIKKMGLAAFLGLLILSLFIAFRVWLSITWNFQQKPWLDIVHYSQSGASLLDAFHKIFVSNIVVTLAIPTAIWSILLFKKSDFIPVSSRKS